MDGRVSQITHGIVRPLATKSTDSCRVAPAYLGHIWWSIMDSG